MSSLIVEVCKIENVEKHPNADKLDIVTIKGWNCIVGRDQYKVGDLVVYVPPQSIIPPDLIEKYNLTFLENGGRVKSIRLRGCRSEGLILDLPDGNFHVGQDVANVLGITKWEPPQAEYQNVQNKSKKFLRNVHLDTYTDIENAKNFPKVFVENDEVVVTEKIHGTNARFGTLEIETSRNSPLSLKISTWFKKHILGKKYEFVLGSHHVQLPLGGSKNNFYGENLWGKIAKKYKLAEVIPPEFIVYGEIFGPGIQDLTYGLKEIDLVVFDIKFMDKYLPWSMVERFCEEWGLKTVPVLYQGKYSKEIVDKLVDGKSILCPDQIREGIVVKDMNEGTDRQVGRKILKYVSIDYLTRKNGTEYT